jgi:hypothetical protein
VSERFRFRRLKPVDDPSAIAAARYDSRHDGQRGHYRLATETEAPKAVLVDEAEATREDLVGMLRAGTLMPTDLVFSHGGWATFEHAPEFFEACEGLTDKRALVGNARAVGRLVLSILVLLAIVAIRLWLA